MTAHPLMEPVVHLENGRHALRCQHVASKRPTTAPPRQVINRKQPAIHREFQTIKRPATEMVPPLAAPRKADRERPGKMPDKIKTAMAACTVCRPRECRLVIRNR